MGVIRAFDFFLGVDHGQTRFDFPDTFGIHAFSETSSLIAPIVPVGNGLLGGRINLDSLDLFQGNAQNSSLPIDFYSHFRQTVVPIVNHPNDLDHFSFFERVNAGFAMNDD